MIPIELRIQNFKSFGRVQAFRFPQEPGLYFMQGINEAEPRLEANGAGKSTIWDALSWLCFDRTPLGLKAGDVNNWDTGKATMVELDFLTDAGAQMMTMCRTWKPNSWTLDYGDHREDLAKSKANPIFGWLALEFAPFLNSVMMAQGQPMFLDLKSEPQAALFSEVMGLDLWMESSAKASKKASDQDRIARQLERQLSELQGQLAGLGREDLKASAKEWEEARELRLDEVARTLDGYELHSCAQDDLKAAEQRELEARAAFQAQDFEIPGLDQAAAETRVAADQLRREMDLAQLKADHLEGHLAAAMSAEPCPTCGHEPTREEVRPARDLAAARMDDQIALIVSIDRKLKRATEVAHAARADLDKADRQLSRLRKDLDAARDATANARRKLQLEHRDIDRLEDQYERIKEEVNPFAKLERRAQEDLQRLTSELREARDRLDDCNAKMGLYSFWVRGFKEVRLQQIAEALTELEIEVNSSVEALGLVGWALKFQVDRETKGGSIARGFNVSVWSPHNQIAVPWAAWSGGEGQRLRLAGNMGLSDLIRSRTGATIPLEVWDEPTEGLSPQGIQDLLETLAIRARTEQRCVWIVDHRAHNFGGFTGSATIIKTNSGSRIRQS